MFHNLLLVDMLPRAAPPGLSPPHSAPAACNPCSPPATHVTARASADLGTECVFSGAVSHEAVGGLFENQVRSVCGVVFVRWWVVAVPGLLEN